MARPKGSYVHKIDPEQVKELASLGCTIEEMARVLRCSRDSIERRFRDDIEAGKADLKCRLRRAQIRLALEWPPLPGSATMLVWLGKNMLGQSDGVETTSKIDATCTVAITAADGRSFVVTPGKAEADEYTSST